MIGGAVYSGRFGGANIVVKVQSAKRCNRLRINLSLAMFFLQHIDIYEYASFNEVFACLPIRQRNEFWIISRVFWLNVESDIYSLESVFLAGFQSIQTWGH